MRLAAIPQNFRESIALAAGLVPTPLMDTLVALLLAKTVIAATAIGIFDALEAGPPNTPCSCMRRAHSRFRYNPRTLSPRRRKSGNNR